MSTSKPVRAVAIAALMSAMAAMAVTAAEKETETSDVPTSMEGMSGMSGMAAQEEAGSPWDAPIGIDSVENARKIAEAWLAVGGGTGLMTVGKVRDIDEIFLVSIMYDKENEGAKKEGLRDLLVIRKPDGYTFSVFPTGVPDRDQLAAMQSMSGMSGMQGMVGMSGMQGMGGMSGMQGMGGMSGMQGMGGMSGMQGMGGMSGMQGMGGMSGMQGMGGMSGMQGMTGESKTAKKKAEN